MAGGLTREQLGVTDAMLETYGDVVFRYSNNLQRRRRDPIRELDLDAVDAQRAALGMSDAQIARAIGLTEGQVTFIRNREELERLRSNNFQRLLELGGGKRFRVERFTPHEARFRYSDRALWLRAALRFPADRTRAYVEAGWWRDDTLRGWLEREARSHPEHPAVLCPPLALTYAELAERACRVAAGLAALGVEPGEVVTVQLPNIPEYLVAYQAIAHLGAVMSTLYLPHRTAEMRTLLGHARARALICPASIGGFSPAAAAADLRAAGDLPDLDHVVVVGSAVPGSVPFAELERTEPLPLPAPVAADPMLLLYTSGTTAGPKGVPHTAHTLLSNARAGVEEHGIVPDDVFLSAAPFGHLFGQYSLQLAWAAGAASLLLTAYTPTTLAQTVARERPSVLFAAPAQLHACLNAGFVDARDWSALRMIVTAGSAVAPSLIDALAELLPRAHLCQLWGMTETQAGTYTRPSDPAALAARSAGRPSPGTEVRAVGEHGEALPPGREGELEVRGPLLFPGYLDNSAANEAAFRDGGWFRTGDLCVIDAAGNVSITGRLKDVINRGGVKYNPREVEELVDRHPAVQLSAVVPMADPVLGERACCFVVLEPGASLTLEALCAYLAESGIAKVKLPEALRVVQEMPLTPTRKVIKGKLPAPGRT